MKAKREEKLIIGYYHVANKQLCCKAESKEREEKKTPLSVIIIYLRLSLLHFHYTFNNIFCLMSLKHYRLPLVNECDVDNTHMRVNEPIHTLEPEINNTRVIWRNLHLFNIKKTEKMTEKNGSNGISITESDIYMRLLIRGWSIFF